MGHAGVTAMTGSPEAPQPAGTKRLLPVFAGTFAALLVAAGALGTCVGLVKGIGAVGGESVDPSQKARILAEGISEAMNYTAMSILVAAIGGLLFLVRWLVTRRARPPSKS
jgi:hypothetical protein